MTSMLKGNFRTQRGFALVDALVGLAITGMFVTTLLSSISTGVIGLVSAQNTAVADSLARSQLESIKGQSYLEGGGYSTITAPAGYSITNSVQSVTGADPSAMQEVTVTVYRGSKIIRVVRDFKVNR